MDDKKVETEEELRARLKEELKAELLAELKAEKKETKTESKRFNSYESSRNNVKFDGYNDRGIKEATALHNKDKKFDKNEDVPKVYHLPQANDESTTNLFSVILLVVVIGIIIASYMLLPKIYQWFSSRETPSTYVDPTPDKPKEPIIELEEITLESDEVLSLTYPIMRNNPYSTKTYYSNSVVNIGDFSNNDLLYNAFIHVYSGNIGGYDGGYNDKYCGTELTKKTFNAKYIDARMDNLFTETVNYEHKTFKVPSTNLNTEYVGTWKYDSKNNRYIYYGDCNPTEPSNIVYYDLTVAYDAKGLENNTVIEVYYHVAFAKVNKTNKTYVIYSDASMKNQILKGTLKSSDYAKELKDNFNSYISSENQTSKYKYTFSSKDCSYQNHCFVKGEWLE